MEILKPIRIKIFYDENLKKITRKDFEEAVVSDNLNFTMFLDFLFSSYPKISKKFTPGTLGFLLNKMRPKETDVLKDGDILEIKGLSTEDVRREIENAINAVISYYSIDITFEEIKNLILNEKDHNDLGALTEVFTRKLNDVDEVNSVLRIINMAWNYFPHETLGGKSPHQITEEHRKRYKRQE